ncbi:unnamed protein product [Closterium sp. NIES-65]|nr:unnamed protein product [Closterium sp. NIES-65]
MHYLWVPLLSYPSSPPFPPLPPSLLSPLPPLTPRLFPTCSAHPHVPHLLAFAQPGVHHMDQSGHPPLLDNYPALVPVLLSYTPLPAPTSLPSPPFHPSHGHLSLHRILSDSYSALVPVLFSRPSPHPLLSPSPPLLLFYYSYSTLVPVLFSGAMSANLYETIYGKSTGQLSVFTTFLTFAGCIARLFTSI